MSISHFARVRMIALGLLAAMPSLLPTANANTAGAEEAAPSIVVRYHDLDLSGPKGVEALYGRIRVAANEVCQPLESRDVSRKHAWSACIDHAVADAVCAVHNRTLSAYHWQKTRGWAHRDGEGATTLALR